MTVFPHQSSLSREERERIRREWVLQCAADLKASNEDIAQVTADVISSLLAELEQAERVSRQFEAALETATVGWNNAEARLAKVPALVEALKEITAAGDEMTYVPEPRAHQIAADALAAWQEPE